MVCIQRSRNTFFFFHTKISFIFMFTVASLVLDVSFYNVRVKKKKKKSQLLNKSTTSLSRSLSLFAQSMHWRNCLTVKDLHQLLSEILSITLEAEKTWDGWSFGTFGKLWWTAALWVTWLIKLLDPREIIKSISRRNLMQMAHSSPPVRTMTRDTCLVTCVWRC